MSVRLQLSACPSLLEGVGWGGGGGDGDGRQEGRGGGEGGMAGEAGRGDMKEGVQWGVDFTWNAWVD